MASIISSIAATLILVAAQKYFSRRPNWLLGAVVPILSVALMFGAFQLKGIPLSAKNLTPCIIILLLEILIWVDQRFALRQAEINKMKAKDL